MLHLAMLSSELLLLEGLGIWRDLHEGQPVRLLLYNRNSCAKQNCCAVVWTKENPTPWNDIKPNEGTKMLTVNQHFEKG